MTRITLLLDSSGQIKRLHYSSSLKMPAHFSASLLEHLISIWLSFSVFTAPSINAGKVAFPNANCLTGSSLHPAFLSLPSHRPASDPVLQEQTDTGCCTHQLHNCTALHSTAKKVSTLIPVCESLQCQALSQLCGAAGWAPAACPAELSPLSPAPSAPTPTAGSSPPPTASQCLGAQYRHLKHHNINKLWVRWREK